MTMESGGDASFGATVSVVAARYANTNYGGDYEGVVARAGWSMDRYAAGAALPFYRLYENGADQRGLGDLVVHGQVAIAVEPTYQAGLAFAVSLRTGNDRVGLGMGHLMVMPAAWGSWRHERVSVLASVGYSRACVDGDSTMANATCTTDTSGHVHGPWPLVEPMNMSEITWSGGGEVALGSGVRTGARLTGGVPVGGAGTDRVIGAARVAWASGRVETAGELQVGFAGDPFTVRGVVESTLHF